MTAAATVSPLAGKPPPAALLIEPRVIEHEYYTRVPEFSDSNQRVHFGTSGHRGSPLRGSFNESHIMAITQAICDFRTQRGYGGPLFLGRDTHAVSEPAQRTAIEVLVANGVQTLVASDESFTPTPAISHAIIAYNRGRSAQLADGIVITPSHNPPEEGGFKYNPPHGGPAETDVTRWIERRANGLLEQQNRAVRRLSYEEAKRTSTVRQHDFIRDYVEDLARIIDFEAIRTAGVRIGVDPLGGAAVQYWEPIAARYGLDLTVVNPVVDPKFSFMTVDHDGKIRMDCSSPYAMARLVALKDRYSIAFANDTDADRHGIVTPRGGLMSPNAYLAVAIEYLLGHREAWDRDSAIGKTLVSSSLIDRVVARSQRRLWEVPVGFKWFVPRLSDSTLCFAGEESAGASFLRVDGRVWTTDKDGLIMGLLAAEILARSGQDPADLYRELTQQLGESYYVRLDAPLGADDREKLTAATPEQVTATALGGEPLLSTLARAPGNDAPIGGLKLIAAHGWVAVRPSGTEELYKLYAESFLSAAHLQSLTEDARAITRQVLASARTN